MKNPSQKPAIRVVLIVHAHIRVIRALLLALLVSNTAIAEQNYTYLSPVYEDSYHVRLLELALEKTRKSHGDFTLLSTPKMARERAMERIVHQKYPNAFTVAPPGDWIQSAPTVKYVSFPLLRGVLGYRVCFHSSNIREHIRGISSLRDLQKFTLGQGSAWIDTDILRHNGVGVIEIGKNDLDDKRTIARLYQKVAAEEVDLFCRGAGEAEGEREVYGDTHNLVYDESFAIYYPFPFFFFTHGDNAIALERIQTGLVRAYNDGDFLTIWNEKIRPFVSPAKLESRKVINLKNPWLEKRDRSFERFIYRPE